MTKYLLCIHSVRRCAIIFSVVCATASPVFAQRETLRLTHGPMLGKPTASSISVWGRTSEPGPFVVRYGTVGGRLDQASQPATTKIEHDNTGVAELTGLKPDTRYYYHVFVNGHPHGLPGSFHTLPSSQETRNEPHNPKG